MEYFTFQCQISCFLDPIFYSIFVFLLILWNISSSGFLRRSTDKCDIFENLMLIKCRDITYLHTWLILRLGIKIGVKIISLKIQKVLCYCILVSSTTFKKSDAIMIPRFSMWLVLFVCLFFSLKFMRSLHPWCLFLVFSHLPVDLCAEPFRTYNYIFSSWKLFGY